MSLESPYGRLGSPFGGPKPIRLLNNSGATITKGQVAAIDITDAAWTKVVSTGSASGVPAKKNPIVIATEDVANLAEGNFCLMGAVPAIVKNGDTGYLAPDTTNATGGNYLKAYAQATGIIGCGYSPDTGDGSTPIDAVFDGWTGRGAGYVGA